MEWVGGLIASLISAWFCYFIADRNGMNRLGWPLLGLLCPLFGAVVSLLVAFLKQKDPA